VEGTGPEHPAPTGQAPPAIEVASLPIGGRPDDRTTVHQCVKVSWLGPGVPGGVSIVVTAVRIEPSGVFSLSGSGCGRPPCGASFVFAHKGDTCTVAVTAKGSPGSTAQLRLDGRLRCPQGRTTACREFAATLDGRWIDLSVPDPPMPAAASPSPSTD
jgi:hypothetical protein